MKTTYLLSIATALLALGSTAAYAGQCCLPNESGFCSDGSTPVCPPVVSGVCGQAVQKYVSDFIATRGKYSPNSIFSPFGPLPVGFTVASEYQVSAPAYYEQDNLHSGAYLVHFGYQIQGGPVVSGLASICAPLKGDCKVFDQAIGVEPHHGSVSTTIPCGQ
jgi:hypothetical protein